MTDIDKLGNRVFAVCICVVIIAFGIACTALTSVMAYGFWIRITE